MAVFRKTKIKVEGYFESNDVTLDKVNDVLELLGKLAFRTPLEHELNQIKDDVNFVTALHKLVFYEAKEETKGTLNKAGLPVIESAAMKRAKKIDERIKIPCPQVKQITMWYTE